MGPNASEIRHAAQDAASALLIRHGFGTLVCYLRHGDRVFGTYWTSGRGMEAIVPSDGLLDMTVYDRQETWEDSPAGWPHWWKTTGDQWRTDGRPHHPMVPARSWTFRRPEPPPHTAAKTSLPELEARGD